jgi:3-oxoadipate enol-lactonase
VNSNRDFATCSDGTKIFFRVDGKNDAPRVALLHSLAMDHRFWQPVIERLANNAIVLSVDCRGHGRSDKPSSPYSTELFARDLSEVLDQIGWRSATVAGASMGGCVSLAFASSFPDRTDALGLIDTTAWYGPSAPKDWAVRADKAIAEGLGGLIDFQIARWFSEPFREKNPDVVRSCVDVFLANDLQAYAQTCRMLGNHNMTDALPGISCATTIVVGEEDYATPVEMAQTLHKSIKNSRMMVVEKARHLTPLEVPELIADEIRKLSGAART